VTSPNFGPFIIQSGVSDRKGGEEECISREAEPVEGGIVVGKDQGI